MPLIDLSNPAGNLGAEQLAGPFGSILGPGATFPNSYEFGKRFVSASTPVSKNGNGVTSLDDPTYLGFSLQFIQNSPLFNGTEGGEGSESAIGYLEKVGQVTRANYLRAFITGIQSINRERPYYWQTIDGLGEAFNSTFEIEDPYSGSAEGEGITIGCLEAIDLKLSALFTLYKLACYDVKYKRYILPNNLMDFDVYVHIQEIRKFKTVRNYLNAFFANSGDPTTADFVNENTSQITFKFSECKWIASESGKVFDSVTNAGGNEMAVSSMKWSYARVEMESQFSGFDSKLIDSAKQQPTDEFNTNTITKFAKDSILNKSPGEVSLANRTSKSLIQNLFFGNVFGLINQGISAIQNPQGLSSALQGAAIQENQISNNRNTPSLGDNPLGTPILSSNSLPTEKIFTNEQVINNFKSIKAFENSPSGPSLKSTNIFKK